MKKLLLTLSLFLFSILTNAQAWAPVGNGVNGYVNTLFVYDSVMYVGGSFTSPGNNVAQWNDTIWSSLSSGTNNQVYAFGSYNGLIYVGGYFSKAGGHSAGSIATWNGTSFANAGFDLEGGSVNAFTIYDSLLVIGGQFDSVAHEKTHGLATWNGKKVDSIQTTYPSDWYTISILATYNNLLIPGIGPIHSNVPVLTWNNKKIYWLGYNYFYSVIPFYLVYLNAFCQANGNLYMGGSFLSFSNISHQTSDTIVNNIAMWNGHKWNRLGKGIHGTVYALAVYDSLIIAGGSFDSAGGVAVNNIAAWNGTSWSALGNGVGGTVFALAVFDSNLYAGGDFSSPGNGIARYDASFKIVPAVTIDSIAIFPNPNTGQFTVVCNPAIIKNSQPTIEVYNIIGEKIYSANLFNSNTTIDLGKQPPGVYLYKIFNSEGNLISPGKLLIE